MKPPILVDKEQIFYQYHSPVNPILVRLPWFSAKTMPPIKGKRQAGINLIPTQVEQIKHSVPI